MSPRPRKVSDDEIFGAIVRVMMRVRPVELTLAKVGQEAGITASALVQRFGSRAGMMRALNAKFAEGTGDMLEGVRVAHASPLAALFAYAEGFAGMAESPATLAHHLAYLEQDLSDPEMYEHVRAHTIATRATLQRWIEEAIGAGELSPNAEAAELARGVHTTVTGSMMSFAFFREGEPAAWLRDDLAFALRPYLALEHSRSRSPSDAKRRGARPAPPATTAAPHEARAAGSSPVTPGENHEGRAACELRRERNAEETPGEPTPLCQEESGDGEGPERTHCGDPVGHGKGFKLDATAQFIELPEVPGTLEPD